jgi:sugar lactone lactonase YvrE
MLSKTFLVPIALLTLCNLFAGWAAAHPASGIAVDERGRVYFQDTREGLWRADEGGKLTLVKKGGIHWMTVDRDGRFADSPDEFGLFTRLTPKGEKPTLIGCAECPCAIGKDGNLYYAKMNGLTIARRSPSGKESVLVETDKVAVTDGFGVIGMACGPEGTLYIVALDSLNRTEGHGVHMIWKVKTDGTVGKLVEGFVKAKNRLPAAEQDSQIRPEYCRGIAVDGNGDVYVAVTGSRCVIKLTPKGEASVVHRTAKPWAPTGVDVFKGELYVLEYDGETPAKHGDWPPRVKKVGRDGKAATVVTVARSAEP